MEATTFEVLRDRVQTRLLSIMDDRIERLGWGATRIEEHQREGLRALLEHAIEYSPFHRRRLSGVDPGSFELRDLGRLPVMTKSMMMDQFDDVVTDRRVTRDAVEHALARTADVPVPIASDYVAMHSGGSSGRRGVFVFDDVAVSDFFASLSRSLTRRLVTLGGVPGGGFHIAMVAASSATHATGSVPAWTAGGRLPFRFTSVPVTQPLPDIVGQLNALDAPALYGYATMLGRLAAEKRAGRLRISPMAVTSTSETLPPQLRTAIGDAFGTPVVDVFGSTEGLVGVSGPGENILVFNSDVCIVECVDVHDRPVPPGCDSAKVLVTNLSNRVQPLIRYELHDRFERIADTSTDGHLRALVHGRSDDVLHYGDTDVHPLVVRTVMAARSAVLDYQVRQTSRGADVSVIAERSLDIDELRRDLTLALARTGLAQPEVSVRCVEALDLHPATGKGRRFIPL